MINQINILIRKKLPLQLFFLIMLAPLATLRAQCVPVPDANGCNLVLNGDFEQFNQLPVDYEDLEQACGWSQVMPSPVMISVRASIWRISRPTIIMATKVPTPRLASSRPAVMMG